jgi:hypothetical protein
MKEAYDEKLVEISNFQALEEAIKTMRRTEVYGFTDNAVDFEWPMPNDLLQMKKNTPINIQDLKYKICSQT